MDDKLNDILDRLSPKRPRSRLDPHGAVIEEMRRRGRTYREIARVLAENCLVQSSPSNIYYFVKLRARAAKQEKAQQARQTQAESVGSSKSSAQATVRNPRRRPRICRAKLRRESQQSEIASLPSHPPLNSLSILTNGFVNRSWRAEPRRVSHTGMVGRVNCPGELTASSHAQ